MEMKCKIGGREVELAIEQRVRGGVVGHTKPNKPCAGMASGSGDVGAIISNPAPSPYAPFKNKLEKAFATQLDAEKRAGVIQDYLYEPFSFKLASGKRYRVDFVTWGDEGTVCYECKGYHKNIRDSITHLKWAAQRFPFFKWRKVTRRNGRFESIDIVV
jgi:hypothetical protein